MRARVRPASAGGGSGLRHSRADGGVRAGLLRVRRGGGVRVSAVRWARLERGVLAVWAGGAAAVRPGAAVGEQGGPAWSVRVAECAAVEERRAGVALVGGGGRVVASLGAGGCGAPEWDAWVAALREAWACRLEAFYLVERVGMRDGGREDGLIGKGHYADVFRAVDRASGEMVAVKAIRKAAAGGGKRRGKGEALRGTAAVVAEVLGADGGGKRADGKRADGKGADGKGADGKGADGKGADGKGRPRQAATAAHIVREAEILRAVSHPNVVRCLDQFETTDVLYLVMELAPHGTLADVLDAAPAMTEDAARAVVQQLLRAVLYLHEAGIVHRDIKPENVLLAAGGALKLADFGLSRFLRDPALHPADYSLTSVLGTPSFCAPEVVRKRAYGAPVDCWAAGVVLHLALTGRFPFRARTPDDVFLALTTRDRVPFPRSRWACVSPAARDLVRGLLAFDPDARLTAREALYHPWVIDAPPPRPASPLSPAPARAPVPTSASFAPPAANSGAPRSFPASQSARHAPPVQRRLATAVAPPDAVRRLDSSPQLSAPRAFSRVPSGGDRLPAPRAVPAVAEPCAGAGADGVFVVRPRQGAAVVVPAAVDAPLRSEPPTPAAPTAAAAAPAVQTQQARRSVLPGRTRRVQSFRPAHSGSLRAFSGSSRMFRVK